MKSAPVRPTRRYYNGAVFRSAQRLLAVPPRPPVKKSSHLPVFTLGAVLGLLAALALTLQIKRTPLKVGTATVTSVFDIVDETPAPKSTQRPPPARAIPPAAARASTTPSTIDSARAEIQAAVDVARQRSANEIARAPKSSSESLATPTLPGRAAPAAQSQLVLRGELRAPGVDPQPIEFILIRAIGARGIQGQDRFIGRAQDGTLSLLIAVNTVEGEVELIPNSTNERTLKLRETSATTNPGHGVGRQFVIALPNNNSSSQELSGTWFFGSTNGTLVLTAVSQL